MPAPDAPPNPPAAAKTRRRWPWWKRGLAGVAILLLLLVLFYRPIIFAIVKVAARKAGESQHLKIDFDISGSILAGLRIENLRISPTAPGPIEKANVGLIELHYSLLTLARHGLNSAFIESVVLHDADIVYDPSKSPPSPPKKKEPFSLPPLPLPRQLSLRNVNFLMRPDTPEGAHAAGQNAGASAVVPAPASPAVAAATESLGNQGLLVKGLTLELDPDRPGQLRVAELRIPAGPDLTDVAADTSYRDRNLQLTDVRLAPEIHLRQLGLDGSRLEQQLLGITLDADRLLGGTANLALNVHGLGTPPHANLTLDIARLSLPDLLKFLKLDLPLAGSLDDFHVAFDGNTDQPKSWSGGMEIRAGGLAYGDATTAPIERIFLRAKLDHGVVDLQDAGVAQGGNRVAANAHFLLAEKMEDLPRSDGHGTLTIDAPDFTQLPVKLPQEIDGSFHADGGFTLAGGKLAATLKAHLQNLGVPAQKVTVRTVDLSLDTSKVLPEDATAPPAAPGAPPPPHLEFYDRLQTHLAVDVEGIAYADYRVDNLKLALSTDQANVRLDSVELNRGPNKINVDAAYVLPADFANWQKQPLDADLSIALPDVSQFSADPRALPLKGLLTAKGNVSSRDSMYSGGLDLQIRDLQARGATVQTGDVVVAVENNRAVVKTGRVVFDDKNNLTLAGSLDLSTLNLAGGVLSVNLNDLSRFKPTLAANGISEPVGGSLRVMLTADGLLAPRPGTDDAGIGATYRVNGEGLLYGKFKVPRIDVQGMASRKELYLSGAEIDFDGKANHASFDGTLKLDTPPRFLGRADVTLDDLAAFAPLLQPGSAGGEKVGGTFHLSAKAAGNLNSSPGAHDQRIDANLLVEGRDIQAKGAKIESIDTQVVVVNNHATINTGQIKLDPKSGVTFAGQADLAAPYTFQGNLNVDLPDLGAFNSLLATPPAPAKPGEDNHGSKPAPAQTKLGGSFHLAAQAGGHLDSTPDANDQRIDGTVDINGADITANGARIERVTGNIVAANNAVTIRNLTVRLDDKNSVNIDGHANAAAPFDYDLSLNVNIADLARFEPLVFTPTQARQATQAEMEAAATAKTPAAAQINAPGKTATRQNVVVPSNTTQTSAGKVKVAVRGTPGTPAMRAEIVQPAAPRLGGSLVVDWRARGDFAKGDGGPHFEGGGKFVAHQVVYNTFGPLEADVEGKYSQLLIDFPTIFVGTNGFELRATFALKDALARLDNLHLKQGSTELLAGYAQVPVDLTKLSSPDGPVPDTDQIDVNVASKALPLATLLATTGKTNQGQEGPIKGTVLLEVTAHGSLSKILAAIKVEARGLASPQLATVKPADADFHLTLRDNRLELDTVVRQPQIQPLTIKGNLPVDLKEIAAKKTLDPKAPVALSIELPRSGLGFLAGATKALRFIQGDAAIDVRVGGTVGKPTLAGSLELNIPAARAENITVPAIRDFAARLAFTEKELRFERFAGEIGGGRINLAGRVGFATLTEPTLDLTASARDVLAARDDNLTARVNADVRILGPLAAATVSGRVGITKSRYLKDIDIVPIGQPGKPAPAPPAAAPASSAPAGPGSIGINVSPIDKWKLNLDIKTDDPFFIRGNLANGQALVDLHVRGTGAEPLLDGNVEIKDLVASLAFSRLEIKDGNIAFASDQPLNPTLNITGLSTIRNYLVTVLITGRAQDPKITFISDPPLAQEQIVSLLATGATTDELAGNAQALAGKATLLVAQDLYRRTFKKRESARAEPKSTLADRLNLDVGATDPATGKQEVSAGYKITDTVQFVADLGIQGDLRGRLKYLIRFR